LFQWRSELGGVEILVKRHFNLCIYNNNHHHHLTTFGGSKIALQLHSTPSADNPHYAAVWTIVCNLFNRESTGVSGHDFLSSYIEYRFHITIQYTFSTSNYKFV